MTKFNAMFAYWHVCSRLRREPARQLCGLPRVRPSNTPMAPHRPLYMVGYRPACRGSRKFEFWVPVSIRVTYQSPCAQFAWPLIANFSCSSAVHCTEETNVNIGWRDLLWILGGLMIVLFILRLFVFHLYESPKYLMGCGRDDGSCRGYSCYHEV